MVMKSSRAIGEIRPGPWDMRQNRYRTHRGTAGGYRGSRDTCESWGGAGDKHEDGGGGGGGDGVSSVGLTKELTRKHNEPV